DRGRRRPAHRDAHQPERRLPDALRPARRGVGQPRELRARPPALAERGARRRRDLPVGRHGGRHGRADAPPQPSPPPRAAPTPAGETPPPAAPPAAPPAPPTQSPDPSPQPAATIDGLITLWTSAGQGGAIQRGLYMSERYRLLRIRDEIAKDDDDAREDLDR